MRIHITGASGSGTSTLAEALALRTGGVYLDADDYYWLPTTPRFKTKRPIDERTALLSKDLATNRKAILAGSIVGWGCEIEDVFDLVVFLYLDAETRLERLRAREHERFGHADPAFLAWAAQYDEGPSEGRSLTKHSNWLASRSCKVLELHGDFSVDERIAAVLAEAPDPSCMRSANGLCPPGAVVYLAPCGTKP